MIQSEDFEHDELLVDNTSNVSKWRSKRRPRNYDRPGRVNKAERSFRRGAEHTGKGKTLRDKRKK